MNNALRFAFLLSNEDDEKEDDQNVIYYNQTYYIFKPQRNSVWNLF